jgi:hypothetical protein
MRFVSVNCLAVVEGLALGTAAILCIAIDAGLDVGLDF